MTVKTKKKTGQIVTLILCILLLVLIIGGIAYCTNGFQTAPKSFSLMINEKIVPNDTEGITLPRKSEVKVISLEEEYEVSITANATDENNFTFSIGAEEYKWKDTNGWDFSKGFFIEKTEDSSFAINYVTVEEIFAKVFESEEIIIEDAAMEQLNLFNLTVTSGKDTITVSFGIEARLTPESIILSDTNIIL